MLPGFRFLFAAILLSMSILVFGLGAAALLRAAHEQFASTPSWRALPEPKFAQQNEGAGEALQEPPMAVLARLSVEPEPAPLQTSDGIAKAEPPAIAPMPDQPEKTAALKPQESAPPEAAKPEIPVPDTSMHGEAALVPTPAPATEEKIAAAEQVVAPANEAVPPASGQASVPASPDTATAATKLAALGGQAVAVEAQPPVNAAAKPGQSVRKQRLQARRAKERRRLAQRARLARQAAAQQQTTDPFAQPTFTSRSR